MENIAETLVIDVILTLHTNFSKPNTFLPEQNFFPIFNIGFS